jgi:integrase
MKIKLTDKYILARKPSANSRLVIADTVVPGLSLRINPASRSWLLRYTPKGRSRCAVGLGTYPAMGLAAARKRAGDIVAAARNGRDLIAEEDRAIEALRRAEAKAKTVEVVATDYLVDVKTRLRSWRSIESRFKNHILPALGAKAIGEVRRSDIVELLDKMQHEHGLKHLVNRVRESLLLLFAFAMERELIEANPAIGVKRRKVEYPRERVLSREELRLLWQATSEQPLLGRSYVRTLILTGCRREEARAARWAEIDLDERLWKLPSQRTKAGRPHEIPLSDEMVCILESIPRQGPVLFTHDGERPMAVHQIKARLDRDMGIKDWRFHDIRRSVRSGLAELGVSFEVAEETIGHTMPSLQRTYNLHRYRAEKRAALERWADHVLRIGEGRVAKVVELRPSA